MKKFEYNSITNCLGRQQLINELNILGAVGWECFHIEYSSVGVFGTYTAFLKREIPG